MDKDTGLCNEVVSDMFDKVNEEEKEEDLKMLLDKTTFQVSVLEEQLSVAMGEIKFLREELSSTQLELISSRSEVKVLMEELATYKAEKGSTEEFPDLLLSSLDKLYEDKQQQLWLISGIHNSIDKPKHTKLTSANNSASESSDSSYDERDISNILEKKHFSEENCSTVPRMGLDLKIENGESPQIKKQHPSLRLELKKSYDFNPSSISGNKRSLTTPCATLAPQSKFWTPTTPTPSFALRPSLSLHNLASQTFTEVLIPSLAPPDTHQVTPSHSGSSKSLSIIQLSPSVTTKQIRNLQVNTNKKNINKKPNKQTSPNPQIRKNKFHHSHPSQTGSPPSPGSLSFRSYTSLSSLAEISENKMFMECKKEISV